MSLRPDRSRPSILVVDDDPLQREILVALVGEFGCDGVGASDGARALAAVARSKFHVILMDCHMPTIDGCEVARRIREHEVGARTPIVAVTAKPSATLRERCVAAGADGFIVKPVVPEVLATTLRRWLPISGSYIS